MRIFLALTVLLTCLILPLKAIADDRMISGEFPYEYVEREPPISNAATKEDVLTERFSQRQAKEPGKPGDPNTVFQVLLGIPLSTSISASVSTSSAFGPDFSASGDLEPKAQPMFEFRKIIWNDAPDKISWSYGLSLISIKGQDAAGATASAGLIAFPLHFTFRGIIGQSEERPDGILVPYGAIGVFYYLGSFSVDMGASSGGTTSGLGVPDMRAGLQWNWGENSSMLLELRHFSVSLDYSGGDYDIFNSDTASMDISQSMMSLGFKSGF